MIMNSKIIIALVCVLSSLNAYAAPLLSLSPEQGDSLVQIIINIVTFLCGLFINPKKKKVK